MIPEALVLPGIFLVASFVQGLTGFGLGLVSVAVLSLIYEPDTSVPLAVCFGFLVTIPVLLRYRKHIRFRVGLLLALASYPGAFLGTLVLSGVSSVYLYIFMGVFLVGTSVYGLTAGSPKIMELNTAVMNGVNCSVGLLSGFLGTSIGGPGPPVVLWLNTRPRWKAEEVKATLSFFFLLQGLGALAGFAGRGLLNPSVLRLVLFSVPGFVAGTAAGLLCFDFFQERNWNYRNLVHYLLVLAGARLVVLGLAQL